MTVVSFEARELWLGTLKNQENFEAILNAVKSRHKVF